MTDDKMSKAEEDIVSTITSSLLDAVEGRPVDYVVPVVASFLSLLLYHSCGAESGAEYLRKVGEGMIEDEDEIRIATDELFKSADNAPTSKATH